MAAAMHTGEDPFGKVKGLIQDMIERLEDEAGADATQKAYCDKENAESEAKKADNIAEIEKLTTKIDQASARSAKLKEEVSALQEFLKKLAESRAWYIKDRQDEHDVFVQTKADLEQGIEGVKLALKVLRDYYGKQEATSDQGAGTSIIGLLEVCESDFTKGLTEAVASEEEAQRNYEQIKKDDEVEQATKEKDVEYKTKEATKLDKVIAEATKDRATVQTELDAVLEYLAKLRDMCVAKVETYADRKAHREAEIAGLKEALNILENEASTALIQKQKRRRTLRGSRGLVAHVA